MPAGSDFSNDRYVWRRCSKSLNSWLSIAFAMALTLLAPASRSWADGGAGGAGSATGGIVPGGPGGAGGTGFVGNPGMNGGSTASHLERKFVTLVDSSNLCSGESSWLMQVSEAGRSRR